MNTIPFLTDFIKKRRFQLVLFVIYEKIASLFYFVQCSERKRYCHENKTKEHPAALNFFTNILIQSTNPLPNDYVKAFHPTSAYTLV